MYFHCALMSDKLMYVDFAIPFDILSENKGQCQPSVLRGSKEYWLNHEQ